MMNLEDLHLRNLVRFHFYGYAYHILSITELKYVQILSYNTQGLSSDPIILIVPQRCSRRLAAKAEPAGGRLVYSHTDAPRVIMR